VVKVNGGKVEQRKEGREKEGKDVEEILLNETPAWKTRSSRLEKATIETMSPSREKRCN